MLLRLHVLRQQPARWQRGLRRRLHIPQVWLIERSSPLPPVTYEVGGVPRGREPSSSNYNSSSEQLKTKWHTMVHGFGCLCLGNVGARTEPGGAVRRRNRWRVTSDVNAQSLKPCRCHAQLCMDSGVDCCLTAVTWADYTIRGVCGANNLFKV